MVTQLDPELIAALFNEIEQTLQAKRWYLSRSYDLNRRAAVLPCERLNRDLRIPAPGSSEFFSV